jgi:deoxyuridine 5'-triphosphate nucleotidohydrolase
LLRVEGEVKGQKVQMLVDSGASRNFLSTELAEELKLEQQRYGLSGPQIRLGNGSIIPVEGHVEEVPVWIEGKADGVDFEILPMKGKSAILGMPWLRDVNPHIDWANMTIQWQEDEEKLLVKRLSPEAVLPKRSTKEAAGYDLSSVENVTIEPGHRAIVSTGLAVAIPKGCYARLAPRSGLAVKFGIHVGAGVVDRDYRGPVKLVIMNLGQEAVHIQRGDRIAQMILEQIKTPEVEEVQELEETIRNENGFGSTGMAQLQTLEEEPTTVLKELQLNVMAMENGKVWTGARVTGEEADMIAERIRKEFADVLVEKLPPNLPPRRDVEFAIELVADASPPYRHPYRMSQPEREALKAEIDTWLDNGWIRHSVSPFAAATLNVPKKDGSVRVVIDYRAINDLTIKNRASLPHIDDLFDTLQGAAIFSKVDLASGYYQVRVKKGDEPKTAFNTPFGHFEFLVMPMGMTNAPATFMTLMNQVLRPYINKSVVVFLDDVLIFSKTPEEHLHHVREVLTTLRQHQLYAKVSKCEFARKQVEFLGHVVSERGLETASDKVDKIKDWPIPKNVSEVRSFLGLTGYYRRFIRNYAKVAGPLTELTKKDTKFDWRTEQQEAFDELKQRLITAPVLKIPDVTKPFRVVTDASDYAIGAILEQQDDEGKWHPCAFTSKQLKKAERNWATYDKELLAIKHATEKWRPYLASGHFDVYTDHMPLQYLRSTSKLPRRHIDYLDWLAQYDFTTYYKPGTLNAGADALSRRPDLMTLYNITTLEGSDEFLDEIRRAYDEDPFFARLFALQRHEEPLVAPGLDARFEIEDELVYEISQPVRRLCIPKGVVRAGILREAHDVPIASHFGPRKTLSMIKGKFWWPALAKTVHNYVTSCPVCQRDKALNRKSAGLLQPLERPEGRWTDLTMDFVSLPKDRDGHDAVLVVVDRYTKRAIYIPTHTTVTARETAYLFLRHVFREHGIPKSIITDRDARFTSRFWQELFRLLGTKLKLSTAHHPQTDGQTERQNRTLLEQLRHYVSEHQDNWSRFLFQAEFAYNTTEQESLGMSPFMCDKGREPVTPLMLLNRHAVVEATKVDAAERLAEKLRDIHEVTTAAVQRAQKKQKQQADKRRRDQEFQVGDMVFLNSEHINVPAFEDRYAWKLKPRYIGPFKILEKKSNVTYKLELPKKWRIHPVFHVSKLRKYVEGDEEFGERGDSRPQGIIEDDGVERHVVERIMKHRVNEEGEDVYLVKWEGWPIEDSTWERRSNLDRCEEAIRDFELRRTGEDVEDDV